MATICSICGNKISGFKLDFPLSDELKSIRIRGKCYDYKDELERGPSVSEQDNFNTIKQIFENYKDTIQDKKTNDYLDTFLSEMQIKYDEKIEESEEIILIESNEEKKYTDFMLTTSYDFKGYNISEYKGILSAEVVLGTGFLSEFTAGFSDFFGVENERFARKFEEAKSIAIRNLIDKAYLIKCNAIISLDFDYVMFGPNMIAVIVNGTAVKVDTKTNTDYIECIGAIEKLADLKQKDIISSDEFEEKKMILLSKII